DDGVVRLLDTHSKRLVRALVGHAAGVRALSWTGDGQLLASAAGDKIAVWDPQTGKLVRSLPLVSGHMAWSPRGRTLAVEKGNTIEVWQSEEGKLVGTLSGHTAAVTALAWSDDGKTLLSGSRDRTVRRWQTDVIQPEEVLHEHNDGVVALVWSPASQ